MRAMTSQITGVSIVCWTVSSGVYQIKHQNSASLAFVKGIHRWPVDSPYKGQVTWKMFPFDGVIMTYGTCCWLYILFYRTVKLFTHTLNSWNRYYYSFPGPLYQNGSTLITAWINNCSHHKVWHKITHLFLNFNGYIVEVWEWLSDFIPHIIMDVNTYSCCVWS